MDLGASALQEVTLPLLDCIEPVAVRGYLNKTLKNSSIPKKGSTSLILSYDLDESAKTTISGLSDRAVAFISDFSNVCKSTTQQKKYYYRDSFEQAKKHFFVSSSSSEKNHTHRLRK